MAGKLKQLVKLPDVNYFPHHSANVKDHDHEEILLLQGLRENDQLVFRKLYKNYSKSLLGIICRIVRNEEEAEDVLQETFIRISQSLHLYDPKQSRLFTWMARIARNKSLDHLRRSSRRISLSTLEAADMQINGNLTMQTSGLNTDTIGIKLLLQHLPALQKQVVDLLYFGGYTQTEVAEALNMPLGTIKTRNRMAMVTLRALFVG